MFTSLKTSLRALCVCAMLAPIAAPASAQIDNSADARDTFIYEKPSLKKFSQLYWALNKFDFDNDRVIDNFMLINECEIYSNYINNEFEWPQIRDSGRKYIASNVDEFSTRFEIEQPLRLSEYDFDQQIFKIWEPYRLDGIKLFEILAPEFGQDHCGVKGGVEILGYPRGLIMELPRPVSLLGINMSTKTARNFVKMKGGVGTKDMDKEQIYKGRDVYLVMKVKFFSLKEDSKDRNDGKLRTKVLGALESLEVYADRKRKYLLYSEVFRDRTGKGNAAKIMRERFEKRKAERAAEKAKKAEEAAAKAAKESAAQAE